MTLTGNNPPGAPVVSAAASGAREIAVSVTGTTRTATIVRFTCAAFLQGSSAVLETQQVPIGDGGTREAVFSGLQEGTTYEFACDATGLYGTSTFSDKASALAVDVPAPPTVSTVTVSGAAELSVQLSFGNGSSSPADNVGCRAIQNSYLLGHADAEGGAVIVTGLTPGESYTFECNASNVAGASEYGAASSSGVIAVLPPAPPTLACLTPGTEEARVTVTDPALSDPRYAVATTVACFRTGDLLGSLVAALPVAGGWAATVGGLAKGEVATVQCKSLSELFPDDAAESNASTAFAPGESVTAVYQLRGGTGLTSLSHSDLRGFLDEQLINVASESIFVSTSTDGGGTFNTCVDHEGDGAGGSRRARRLTQAQTTLQVKARVLVDDTSSGANDAIVNSLGSLTGDLQSWASSATGSSVVGELIFGPLVLSPEYTDSALGMLEILPDGIGQTVPELDPPFNASFSGPYYVNITSETYRVAPQANSDLAFGVTVNDVEVGETFPRFTVEDVYPARQGYTVTVTAGDQTSVSSYFVLVSYPARDCSAACNNGFCNGITGQCECSEGYYDGSSGCSAFCPGASSAGNESAGKCSGKGRCCDSLVLSQPVAVREDWGCLSNLTDACVCEETYAGPDCAERVCPPCQNNRSCIEGSQDLDSVWSCDCGDEYSGEYCEGRACPNDCSFQGVCNTETGECTCNEGFGDDDCSWQLPSLVAIENAVEVSLVWGIKTFDEDNGVSTPVYNDPRLNLDASMQNWILETCSLARADKRLQVRQELPCWIEKFASDVTDSGAGFPVATASLENKTTDWFGQRENEGYKLDLGTTGAGYSGQVLYSRVRMRINIKETANVHDLQDEYLRWVEFVDGRNDLAPTQDMKMLMVSAGWTKMDVELTMVRSSITSVCLSIFISFGVVTLFTGNILLSSYTIVTIILSMMTLFFFLIWVVGTEFGPIQIIGLTTFVGLSVDYTLHTCHGYHESGHDTSRGKTTDSLMRLGPAIVGGALTTAGATVFLFFCWILPFYQLGVMLFLNTLITIFLTFFFLMPLLMIAGPRGECCDIYALLLCRAMRRALQDDMDDEDETPKDVTPVAKEPRGRTASGSQPVPPEKKDSAGDSSTGSPPETSLQDGQLPGQAPDVEESNEVYESNEVEGTQDPYEDERLPVASV